MPKIGIHLERLRGAQGKRKPEPLALLNEDKIVVVASVDAEAAGVRAGQTLSASTVLCPGLSTAAYDRVGYETLVSNVWDLIARESSFVEPVSPEKCFAVLDRKLALSLVKSLIGPIGELTGGDIRVGLGRSKILAEQASLSASPLRYHYVKPDDEIGFLGAIPICELPIDPKSIFRLHRLGLTKLRDVRDVDGRRFSRQFREAIQKLQQLALGNDNDPVRPLWPRPVLRETFAFDDVPDWDRLEAALRGRCERLAGALRRDRQYCRTLSLMLTLENQLQIALSEELVAPASTEVQLFRGASRLLRRLYTEHSKGCALEEHMFPVVGFAIVCGGLDIASGIQQTLLDLHGNALPDERRRKLDSMLGFARGRWGAKAVVDASRHLRESSRSLYAGSLGCRLDEEVDVVFEEERPRQFVRNNRLYPVVDMVDRWHERRWECGRDVDFWIYQVQTPSGLAELSRTGNEWRLRAMAD